MKLLQFTCTLTLAAAALASPAHAGFGGPLAVACGNSIGTIAGAGYALQCQGPLAGTIGVGIGEIASASFDGQSFHLVGTTNDASGRFSSNPGSVQWGTLSLTQPQGGLFVLGLQGGGTYSLYLFDGGASGLASLDFDTFGVSAGLGGSAGPGLSQAALFTAAVPEPGSHAFMLAGLAALGLMSRRRRAAEPRR